MFLRVFLSILVYFFVLHWNLKVFSNFLYLVTLHAPRWLSLFSFSQIKCTVKVSDILKLFIIRTGCFIAIYKFSKCVTQSVLRSLVVKFMGLGSLLIFRYSKFFQKRIPFLNANVLDLSVLRFSRVPRQCGATYEMLCTNRTTSSLFLRGRLLPRKMSCFCAVAWNTEIADDCI